MIDLVVTDVFVAFAVTALDFVFEVITGIEVTAVALFVNAADVETASSSQKNILNIYSYIVSRDFKPEG
ncbi:12029_t:CDS:2 [Entrophospora sp. SA101]|nr:12029_t:CDS:2 [Entrophospora sp. SA101]